MNYEIELRKEKAEFLLGKMTKWGVEAKISRNTEQWATIEILDSIGVKDLMPYLRLYAFINNNSLDLQNEKH